MTALEIQKKITDGLAGQGSAVDIAGVLPGILGALAERASGTVPVTVKIHTYKKTDDGFEPDTDGVAGTLYVKGFDAFGNTIPEQQLPFAAEEGAETIDVTFDAHQGDTIGVVAKVPDKGASCQLVTKVVSACILEPEVYPAGLYELGDGSLSPTPSGDGYNGTVIVTEDFAILWPAYQNEGFTTDEQFGPLLQNIPFVKVTKDQGEAITDFDGALNTAAILSVIGEGAAKDASKPTPNAHYSITGFFLPSLGILKYLYDHRDEINDFIEAENDEYEPGEAYATIPSEFGYWSSTLCDEAVLVWWLGFNNGFLGWFGRSYFDRVCAVSAFQTLY